MGGGPPPRAPGVDGHRAHPGRGLLRAAALRRAVRAGPALAPDLWNIQQGQVDLSWKMSTFYLL